MKEKIKKLFFSFSNMRKTVFQWFVMMSVRFDGLKDFFKFKPKATKAQKKKIKEFWKKYTHKNRCFFQILYSYINGEFSEKYIPYDLYVTKIDPYLNDEKFLAMDNKCYYPMLFDCKLPKTLFMRMNGVFYDSEYKIISKSEAIEIVKENKQAIFKPATISGGGMGIKVWKADSLLSVEELLEGYDKLKDYVVQDVQAQHADIAKIHPSSLNTIRIMTLMIHGRIEILCGVLRMGANGGQVDNFCGGGIACGLEQDGRLKKYGYPESGYRVTEHPQAGELSQYYVPAYDKAKEMVLRQAEKFPYFRLVAWDVAIDENGEPVLIEANFSKGGLTLAQYTNGPLFGEFTEEVLDEVFCKGKQC